MLKIDNALLQEVGLGSLPDAEKNSLLKHIYETLEMRVGIRLADQMSNEQLDEFERYFEAKDDAGAFKWLETNFPNYKDIVQEEFDKLKAEVAQSAPQILAASQAQAQQPQPMPQAAQPAAAADPYAALQQPPTAPSPAQYGPTPMPPAGPQPQPMQDMPGVQPPTAPAPAQPYAAPPTPPQPPVPPAPPAPQQAQPYQTPQFPTQQPPAGPPQQ